MFANRFTALIDACSLVGVLGRNTLLSLAEVELFRVRWSAQILSETEAAIAELLRDRDRAEPEVEAKDQVGRIDRAFPEAIVEDFSLLEKNFEGALPDPRDVHVLAAAVKCRASMIVTENLKDFPKVVLSELNLEALSADEFIGVLLYLTKLLVSQDGVAIDPHCFSTGSVISQSSCIVRLA